MGWTMKGMVPNPSAVVAHFLVFRATLGAARARPYRDAAQMRLIVKPSRKIFKHLKFKIIWENA